MMRLRRISGGWRGFPVAATALVVALLLLAGVAVILQNESAFHAQKGQETHVQAEILSASVVAALDFGDRVAAQEAVDALRVNRQIRMVAVFDKGGTLVSGYSREQQPLPRSLAASRMLQTPGMVVTAPVTSAGAPIGTVYLAVDPQPFSTRISRYLLIALLVVLAALVIAVLGAAQAAVTRANRELAARAEALAQANAELKHQIAERTKAEDQLRQAQKMQALGQLTGGIAHDFNNLLTVIQGSADMLTRGDLREEKRGRFADAIVQASARAAALTAQLLAFARRQPLKPEAINVATLITGMTDLLDRTLGERIEVVTDLAAAPCTVEADRAQLVSAVLNVAVNARDAMPGGGRLTISTTRAYDADGTAMAAISVTDTGSGMDAETLARAMEPFFTTKEAGKGTGLGLSQVYGFATQSGGDLRIASTPGEGTCVTILLPCVAASDVAVDETPAPRATRVGAVLLVEDNEEVGEFAESLLTELGHRVTRARSGPEALEAVADHRFDVVLSDVVMPMMSGLELAERLETLRPGLPVVLTTGYSDEIARSGSGGRPVILKPYRIEALAVALDSAMATGTQSA